MVLAACAGRGAPESVTSATQAAVQASGECRQDAQRPSSWREMTWAEYRADVSERAARRGVEVIWITRPDLQKAEKSEPSAPPALACAR